MRVEVLGGGLQGCCAALALAERSAKVTLFDKNDALLSRAAVANEGKIHLGYMYAGDPTLSTAKTMMAGALAFAPFFDRYLGQPAQSFSVSDPATYVVHRDSQQSAEEIFAYLRTTHALINEAAEGRSRAYFGKDLQGCCAALALAERAAKVTLFDKNDALLSRAAVANEGKIHLGYMYAGDPTLSTAKTMMAGALSFAPFLERHLGQPAQSFSVSVPATYVVHRDSQQSSENVCAYLRTVHALINEAAEGQKPSLFWKGFMRRAATLVCRGNRGRVRSGHCARCLLHSRNCN